MTQTRRWLDARRRAFTWGALGAGTALTIGLVLLVLAAGVILGRVGLYRSFPIGVVLGWMTALAVVLWAARKNRAALVRVLPAALAEEIEANGKLRRGSITGLADRVPDSGSRSLIELADSRALGWLERNGADALQSVNRRAARSVGVGGSVLAAGMVFFALSGPTSAGGAQFWNPLATMRGPTGPVLLTVDRTEVRRGDSITVSVVAEGRGAATLWLRAPGEPWSAKEVKLDSTGVNRSSLGPLESDRFLHAESGGRQSDTVHVRVRVPALISDLRLTAAFPSYLSREDEPVTGGPDPLLLPVGTVVASRGRVTVPLVEAAWHAGERVSPLEVSDNEFRGSLRVVRDGDWQLRATAIDGGGLEDTPPELNIVAVPDSAPVVVVAVPMGDTAIAPTLRQPVVVDARDDNALVRMEMVSWRVSRLGVVGDSSMENVSLPSGLTDRAVVQVMLDLNDRGYLPGDTARFVVRAVDNAPRAQVGESRTFSLWLPTVTELRQEVGDRSDALREGADSLLEAQRELSQQLEDLAAERQRNADPRAAGSEGEGELPYEDVERARQLSDQQQQALERAAELSEELKELSEAAWSAGITDPEFHRQLEDLQDLLEMALSDELEERLDALREAIEQLDPEGMREALQQLADAADQMRGQLERSRELFERAAIEGEFTTAAAEAEELSARQQEWNRAVEDEPSDSTLAAEEDDLAERADSLASQLQQLGERMAEGGSESLELAGSSERAETAAGQMKTAAQQAGAGERQNAQRSGQSASESLEPLAAELERQRDELREEWRGEVLDAMDRALVETARLAERQQEVMRRLNRGESGPEMRAAQAAARAGVDKVRERLEDAAGKNALISPQTGGALGFARLRMSEALEQLQRATPNTRQAGELAGEAVDGLNAVAYQLVRARSEVEGAESGSGMTEAMERLAQMAEQQGQINDAANEMMSLMPTPGQQMMQELAALAEQQRSLGDDLDQLRAGGEVSGAEELAEEARELARELEAARLDAETIERQEQLFRRLLDAGRTLRSEEEDEREERMSETARQRYFGVLTAGSEVPTDEPRFRYPTWDELRSLTPIERRLVLDYFRRLNGAGR